MRHEKLQDICNGYSDVMRPESFIEKEMPEENQFVYDVHSHIAFCNIHGIGYKAFITLMDRNFDTKEDNPFATETQGRKQNWAVANKKYRKAIMVRHPMERLLSVYR